LNYALINQDSGQAWDFGREVSYYHGYDSDGSWHEGKQADEVVIPERPPQATTICALSPRSIPLFL